MQHALAYAETGHLCLSTLHANNANQTLDRIINFFPETAHRQLFVDLSLHLQAIISQRLIPSTDGMRVPAVELLLRTPYIADLIQKGEIHGIKDASANFLTDSVLAEAFSKFPGIMPPTRIYTSRLGRLTLQKSRSAIGNQVAGSGGATAHAQLPTDYLGIPILVSDMIPVAE